MNERTKKIHALIEKYGDKNIHICEQNKLFRIDGSSYIVYNNDIEECQYFLQTDAAGPKIISFGRHYDMSIFDYSPQDFIRASLVALNLFYFDNDAKVSDKYVVLRTNFSYDYIIDIDNFVFHEADRHETLVKWSTYSVNVEVVVTYFRSKINKLCGDKRYRAVDNDINYESFDGILVKGTSTNALQEIEWQENAWKKIQRIIDAYMSCKIPKIAGGHCDGHYDILILCPPRFA